MGKGGGHGRGQTMSYAIVYAWNGGKPVRSPKWTLGAAEAAMRETLVAANARGGELDIRIVDRATGETVRKPQRCTVCGERWATETVLAHGTEEPTVCRDCEDDLADGPEPGTVRLPAASDTLSEFLVAALRAKGLKSAARPDGTVTVTAHGIDWTLVPQPHAVTGGPCGVWSAVGPAGSRGQFVAASAAAFVATRKMP